MKSWMTDSRGRRDLRGTTRRSFLGGAAGALAASTGAGALAAGCGGNQQQSAGGGSTSLEPVTFLTVIPLNMGFASEVVAELNGHFKREGLQVTFRATRGSASALQAILQGTALITGAGAIESVLHIATKGAPLVSVGMQTHKSPLGFVSAPDDPLREPADWRGKKMGVPSEGGTSELTFQLFLASADVPLNSVQTQVTGFSPGTYELVKGGRIDGYVVGTSTKVHFEQKIPEATMIDPSEYVEEGFAYITSRRSLEEKRDVLQAYMNATRASMEEILDDRDNNYKNIVKLARTKYDFPELADDKLAAGVVEEEVSGWLVEGEENVLQNIPENWQRVYDQLVDVEQVPSGKNPAEWYTNELVSQ